MSSLDLETLLAASQAAAEASFRPLLGPEPKAGGRAAPMLADRAGLLLLEGLSSLSPAECAQLVAWKGRWMLFPDLSALDPECAAALCPWFGELLAFPRVTQPSSATLQALQRVDAEILSLGVETLAGTQPEDWVFSGTDLWLDRVKVLDLESARLLTAFKGTALSLEGLESVAADGPRPSEYAEPVRRALAQAKLRIRGEEPDAYQGWANWTTEQWNAWERW